MYNPYGMESTQLVRAKRLGDVFSHLVRLGLSEDVMESMGNSGVTFAQFETLQYILRHPLSTVGDLSVGLHISYPSATNMVSRLHQKGLIQKRGLRSDRRIVRLALTDEGQKLVENVLREREDRVGKILSGMEEKECVQFLDGLERFIVSAIKTGYGNSDQLCLNCGPERIDTCPLIQADELHQCR